MKDTAPLHIYGVNHSPWVQGVILNCHLLNIPYSLNSCPDSVDSYLSDGMVMPVCRWPNGTRTRDSFSIMRELQDISAPGNSDALLTREDQEALERLFFSYALARSRGKRKLQFVLEWSTMPTGHGAGFASCFRAFMCLYFLLMLTVGRFIARKRGADPDTYERFERHLEPWVQRLNTSPYLSGEQPGSLDCAFMGHIQCMTSGLTDDVIPLLSHHDALTAWLERMHQSLDGYPHDFSLRVRQMSHRPKRASLSDQALFWGTLVLTVIGFPVTLVLLMDAMRRRKKNPARSGAALTS